MKYIWGFRKDMIVHTWDPETQKTEIKWLSSRSAWNIVITMLTVHSKTFPWKKNVLKCGTRGGEDDFRVDEELMELRTQYYKIWHRCICKYTKRSYLSSPPIFPLNIKKKVSDLFWKKLITMIPVSSLYTWKKNKNERCLRAPPSYIGSPQSELTGLPSSLCLHSNPNTVFLLFPSVFQLQLSLVLPFLLKSKTSFLP